MYWTAILVFLLDRLSKMAVGPQTHFSLLPGVIGITYAANTGMAFSLFSGRPWLLGALSLALLAAGYFFLRPYRLSRLSRTAAMLVLGGAAGNLLDRFVQGYVVDMIAFEFVDFAVFNVADTAIVCGVTLLACSLLFESGAWERKE